MNSEVGIVGRSVERWGIGVMGYWSDRLINGDILENVVIQKDQVEGMLSILSPSLNPSRGGREVKSRLLGLCG
jgi:hypothetical protein